MRGFLTFSIMLAAGAVAFGQFGKDRVDAIEEIAAMEGARTPGDPEQEREETKQLAATYLSQRNRDVDAMMNEIFRMSAAAGRSEDPLGAPMGVPLREPISVEATDGSEDSGQGEAGGAMVEGFTAAAKGIDIRGVNPGRNEFLSGSDNIFEGDVVDVSGVGGVFRLWIVEVGEDGVVVMDDKSKRTEKIPLSLGGQTMVPRSWGASGTVEEAPPF